MWERVLCMKVKLVRNLSRMTCQVELAINEKEFPRTSHWCTYQYVCLKKITKSYVSG